MYAQNLAVCTMNLQGHLEISLVSKSISHGNMGRRSGNVTSVQSDMLFNPTGKLIPRFVALVNIDAIVALFSQGGTASSPTELSVVLWQEKMQDLHHHPYSHQTTFPSIYQSISHSNQNHISSNTHMYSIPTSSLILYKIISYHHGLFIIINKILALIIIIIMIIIIIIFLLLLLLLTCLQLHCSKRQLRWV